MGEFSAIRFVIGVLVNLFDHFGHEQAIDLQGGA